MLPRGSTSRHEPLGVTKADLRSRLPALDYVKAAAIVAVALTHAVPGFFDEGMTDIALLALLLTGFHVPAFLFVSGLLSRAETPIGWPRVAERLGRILPPYVVATTIAWMLGLVIFPTPRKFVFTIVTGATFGHFYFVPIMVFCFVLLPLLSRLTAPLLILTAVTLMGLAEAMWMTPGWRLAEMFFWQIRNPVLQFHVGHFVLGIIASRYRSRLVRAFVGHAPTLGLATGVGLLGFVWLAGAHPLFAAHPLARTTYTLTVIAFITALTSNRPAPAAVRFLSDATLTIYLYHWFAYLALMPLLGPMPLGLRMLLLTSVGLGFGTLVAMAGRRLLGSRSRLLLGS
jgi:peptidoglycan/LPS O-acetylase OafA/YrhL